MDRLIDGWTTLVPVRAEYSAPTPQLPNKVWESRLRIFFFPFSFLIFKFKHLRAIEVLATQTVLSLSSCRRRFLDAAFPARRGAPLSTFDSANLFALSPLLPVPVIWSERASLFVTTYGRSNHQLSAVAPPMCVCTARLIAHARRLSGRSTAKLSILLRHLTGASKDFLPNLAYDNSLVRTT
jgi:hypothetical protein